MNLIEFNKKDIYILFQYIFLILYTGLLSGWELRLDIFYNQLEYWKNSVKHQTSTILTLGVTRVMLQIYNSFVLTRKEFKIIPPSQHKDF